MLLGLMLELELGLELEQAVRLVAGENWGDILLESNDRGLE